MTRLICGACHKELDVYTTILKDRERTIIICPHCGWKLPASKKELTRSLVGRKHIHVKHRNGDII